MGGPRRRIDSLQAAGGRLALLMEGRVYVYSLTRLTLPTGGDTAEALLLIGSRMGQSAVEFFYLAPSFLLTGGGGHFVLFDYWSAGCSSQSEFFS